MKYTALTLDTNSIVCYNDIHKWAPNAIPVEFKFGPSFFYIGDVIDLANCANHDLPFARDEYKNIKQRAGLNWIDGNHERTCVEQESIILNLPGYRRAVLDHFDYPSWGSKKASAYRSEPQGAGKLKRGLWVPALDLYERKWGRSSIDDTSLEAAATHALNLGCGIYIGGHAHPEETKTYRVNNVDVIILKRGMNPILV